MKTIFKSTYQNNGFYSSRSWNKRCRKSCSWANNQTGFSNIGWAGRSWTESINLSKNQYYATVGILFGGWDWKR